MAYKRTDKTDGFTLIELIVVLGVVGIISAIAVPKVYGVLEDSKTKACAVSRDYIVGELYISEAMGILNADEYGNIELDDTYKCPSNYEYMARIKNGEIEALCKEHNKEEYYKFTLNIVNEVDGFTSYLNGLGANKDSVQAGKDDNNKEITSMLNKVTNMGVTYWKYENKNNNKSDELCWTSVDVSEDGQHLVPIIICQNSSNGGSKMYYISIGEVKVEDGSVVSFENKIAGTKSIYAGGNNVDFNNVLKYYNKAVEMLPNSSISSENISSFLTHVKDAVDKK